MSGEEKILADIKNNTKIKKILLILKNEFSAGNFIVYPIERIPEENRQELAMALNSRLFDIYKKYINEYGEVVSFLKYRDSNVETPFLFIDDAYEPISVFEKKIKRFEELYSDKSNLYKLHVDYEDLSYGLKNGLITKEELIDVLRVQAKKHNVITPPSALRLPIEELEDLLLELYGEKYKNEFAKIEFEGNVLLNTGIVNCLNTASPLISEDDILNNDVNALNGCEYQRQLLIQVLDMFKITGEFTNLLELTRDKESSLNQFLSEDNKFKTYSYKTNLDGTIIESDEEYEERMYHEFVDYINSFDFVNKQEDRADFIRVSRHLFNKYTKDIEKYEKTMLGIYIDSSEEKRIKDDLSSIEDKIATEIVDMFLKVPAIYEEEFWGQKHNSLVDAFVQENINRKNELLNMPENQRNGRNFSEKRKFLADKFNYEIEYQGTKIKFINDLDFQSKLKRCINRIKENENNPNEIEKIKQEIKSLITLSDNQKNDVVSKINENCLEKLSVARDEYEKIKTGKGNQNKLPTFSSCVERYLEFRKQNPNGTIEEFSKKESGGIKDVFYDVYKKFYMSLEDAVNSIKDKKMTINHDIAILSMSGYLERKAKIYNLKHLNTKQLYNYGQDIALGRILNEKNDGSFEKSINIAFEGYMEFYGGHYKSGDIEETIESDVSMLDNRVANMYETELGKVYLPFRRVTDKQKQEFRKLSEYISLIENGKECPDDENIEIFELLKNKYANDTNGFTALKMQFALGAGIERYKQVVAEYDIKNQKDNSDTEELSNIEENELDFDNEGGNSLSVKDKSKEDDTTDEYKRLLAENEELSKKNSEQEIRIAELERELEREKESHSKTKKALSKAQDIIKSLFEFADKVKNSVFGKFFFRKDIKQLPAVSDKQEENDEVR